MADVPISAGAAEAASKFELRLRGYDREQVDRHLASLDQQLNTLRSRMVEFDQERGRERDRADRAEEQLRNALANAPQGDEHTRDDERSQGFARRLEKLLRTAEDEAGEVRAEAAQEASALIERARAEAETHRHEVEQSLIARTTQVDQTAAKRTMAMDDRERALADQVHAAEEKARRIVDQAQHQADQLREQAQARLDEEAAATADALRHREIVAEQKLARLAASRDELRSQLARVHDLLAAEFGSTPGAPARPAVPTQARPDQSEPGPIGPTFTGPRSGESHHGKAKAHPEPRPKSHAETRRDPQPSQTQGNVAVDSGDEPSPDQPKRHEPAPDQPTKG